MAIRVSFRRSDGSRVTFKAKAKKAAPKRSSRKGVVRFKTRDGWVAFKAKR